MKKALSDITVLDLTRVLAGPYCTMMLADFGANVIKIEVPGKGDDTRAFGPLKNGASMYYANVNRNKKGVTLNLKSPGDLYQRDPLRPGAGDGAGWQDADHAPDKRCRE